MAEVQENYLGIQSLSRFTNNVQNVQSWTGRLFRGGFDDIDPKIPNLKQAALDSIKDVEDDIAKLKEFLATYNDNQTI